jgi:uncharacterized protein (TIGR00730 family)
MTARPIIAVFGSSAPRPGSPEYEDARRLGLLLARAGYGIATGGYEGSMEAASRGAYEAGGYVLGVGSRRIERHRKTLLNRWVREAVHYENLLDRVTHLVVANNGMVVLPGGIGTLSEMALAWSLLKVGEMSPRPLVLVGPMWRQTVQVFVQPSFVAPEQLALLDFVDSPEEAVERIVARVRRD